jgi:hypothetical protein
VHQAITGPQALAMAALGAPDLILLGSGLTDLQRTDVCQQIRVDPLLKEIPIINGPSKFDLMLSLFLLEPGQRYPVKFEILATSPDDVHDALTFEPIDASRGNLEVEVTALGRDLDDREDVDLEVCFSTSYGIQKATARYNRHFRQGSLFLNDSLGENPRI